MSSNITPLSSFVILIIGCESQIHVTPPAEQSVVLTEQHVGANLPERAEAWSERLQTIRRQYTADLERELARMESEKGESHPDLEPILLEIAKVYREHGAFIAGVPVLERALKIAEAEYGSNSKETGAALDYLGTLCRLQGDYARAHDYAQQVLSISKEARGENHASYAMGLNNLAKVHMATGNTDEAEPLLVESLNVMWEFYGAASHEATSVQLNLGNLYLKKGGFGEAEQMLEYALAVRSEALFFSDSAETRLYIAPIQAALGAVYATVGMNQKAEPLLIDALSAMEAKLDESHPSLESVLTSLAAMYEGMEKHAEGRNYRRRAEQIHSANLGFAFLDTVPIPEVTYTVKVSEDPDRPFSTAKLGTAVVYETAEGPPLKLEITEVTPVVVVLTTYRWDENDMEWEDQTTQMVRRDIGLEEFHGLQSVDLRQETIDLQGNQYTCLTGTLEAPDGTMLKFYLAPDSVPLGALLVLEVDNEVVLSVSEKEYR